MNDNHRQPWTPPAVRRLDQVPAQLDDARFDMTVTPGDQARAPTGSGPPRTTLYQGIRRDMGASVTWTRQGEARTNSLPVRLDLVNHSPDGFEWGYPGSGPAQLAFALCLHVLDDETRARRVYQAVKDRLLVPMQQRTWSLTGGAILRVVEEVEAGR